MLSNKKRRKSDEWNFDRLYCTNFTRLSFCRNVPAYKNSLHLIQWTFSNRRKSRIKVILRTLHTPNHQMILIFFWKRWVEVQCRSTRKYWHLANFDLFRDPKHHVSPRLCEIAITYFRKVEWIRKLVTAHSNTKIAKEPHRAEMWFWPFWYMFWEDCAAIFKLYHLHHYMRFAKDWLCEQNRNTTSCYIILKHCSPATATFPLNATIQSEECKALEATINSSPDAELIRNLLDNDGKTYFVGCVQVYCGISQTSLYSLAFVLFSLHSTLLNVSEHLR